MNIKRNKYYALINIIAGLLIIISSGIALAVSFLKGIYNDKLLSVIFKPIIDYIYHITVPKLSLFWENVPAFTPNTFLDKRMLFFIGTYILFIIGLMLFSYGKSYFSLLRRIKKEIDEQLLKEAIKGKKQRQREMIENDLSTIEIPHQSIFSTFHKLYLAPLLVALVSGFLLKYIN